MELNEATHLFFCALRAKVFEPEATAADSAADIPPETIAGWSLAKEPNLSENCISQIKDTKDGTLWDIN